MLNRREHSQIWPVTVNKAGIVRIPVQHDLIVSVSFMCHPGNCLRETSADILSLEQRQIWRNAKAKGGRW